MNDPEQFFKRMGVDPAVQPEKDAPPEMPKELADFLQKVVEKTGGDVQAIKLEGERKNIVLLNLLAGAGPVLRHISQIVGENLERGANNSHFDFSQPEDRAFVIGNILKFLQAKKPDLNWRQDAMIEQLMGEAAEAIDWLIENVEEVVKLEGMPESVTSRFDPETLVSDLRSAQYGLSQIKERHDNVAKLAHDYFKLSAPPERIEHALQLESARQLVHPLTVVEEGYTEYDGVGGFDDMKEAVNHARKSLAANIVTGYRDGPHEDYYLVFEPSEELIRYFHEQTKDTLQKIKETHPDAKVQLPTEIRDHDKKFFVIHGATPVHVGPLDFPRRAGTITRQILQFCAQGQVKKMHAVLVGGVCRMRNSENVNSDVTTVNELVQKSLSREREDLSMAKDEHGEDIMILGAQTWYNPELYPTDNYEFACLRLFSTEQGISYDSFDMNKHLNGDADGLGVANSDLYACRAFWNYIKRGESPGDYQQLEQELIERTLVHKGNASQKLFIPFYLSRDDDEEVPEELPS